MGLSLEPDRDHGLQAYAEVLGIYMGMKSPQCALLPQVPDPAQAGRGCQTHFGGNLFVGNPGVIPQQADDFEIDTIQ